jgi:hypothetical protein
LLKGLMILAGVSIGLMMLSMVVLSIVSAFRSPAVPNGQLAEQPAPAVGGKGAAAPAVASSAASGGSKAAVDASKKETSVSASDTTSGDASTSTEGKDKEKEKEKAGPPLVAMTRATLERMGKPEPLKGVQISGADKLPMEGYSWMVQLLPHLGHEDLYKKFDFKKPWEEDPNEPLTMEVIPAFLNPSDPREKWEGYPFDKKALTHFVGVSGIEDARNVVAAALPRSDPRAGMFGYDGVAKPAEITDGTSQTIMIIGSGELAAPWAIGGGATIRGAREPYFHEITGFGSKGLSKRGAHAAMADGSVRFISSDIDPQVFKAMCTIHGAESIDLSANPHVTASPE